MSSTKKIVFDTNVLLKNPALVTQYSSRVVMTKTILDELDYRKSKREHQEVAQLALNNIERAELSIISSNDNRGSNDEKILNDALSRYPKQKLLIVSNDTGMRLQAENRGIESISLEDFIKLLSEANTKTTPAKQKLYETLLKGQIEQCKEMIATDKQINFNFYLSNGFTPLIDCICNKRVEAADFIISQPSTDFNLLDNAKLVMPAFMHASQRRNISMMKKLIAAGTNYHITAKGKNKGNSALLIAAWDNALNVIKFLLETPNLNISPNQADGNGFTPLIKAAIKGHTEIVEYLLKRRVDRHIRDKHDKSAYDYAVENTHKSIIRLLEQ